MARLHLIVEGQTEQAFAKALLKPHLASRGVYLVGSQLVAHARKKGKVHRGGMFSYAPFRHDVLRRLRQDAADDAFFSTMIDVYRLPRDFPGYAQAARISDPYARVATLEMALEADIANRRFIPYFQLHEFEALLLSHPEAIASFFPARGKEVERLVHVCSPFDTPEKIDDGEQTAPSKRIAAEIPDYYRTKPAAGSAIAAAIGLDVMCAKCPHFHQWLTKLECLGDSQNTGDAANV